MSGWMKKISGQDQKARERIRERLQGEAMLYMGDPALHWGQGGWSRGRDNLIYGPSGSGKSALTLKAAAEEQKKTGGYVIVFDSEYAHPGPYCPDEERALQRYKAAGLDVDKVVVRQSNEVDVLFEGLGDLEKDIQNGDLKVSAIIVDSWGGIESEQAKNKINDNDLSGAGNAFGGNAKTMGPILQHLLRISAENGITMFFVQHCINNMDQYGPKYILLGGQKLRFLCHNILFVEAVQAKDAGLLAGDVASSKSDDSSAIKIGKKVRFRCDKSRAVVEGRKGEFWFDFTNLRFARPEESLFNLATNLGIVAHPKSPLLDKDGKQRLDDDGTPLTKENIAYWEYPVGAPTPKKFHGAAACMEALASDKNFFNDVFAACTQSNNTYGAGAGVRVGVEAGVVSRTESEDVSTKKRNTKAK